MLIGKPRFAVAGRTGGNCGLCGFHMRAVQPAATGRRKQYSITGFYLRISALYRRDTVEKHRQTGCSGPEFGTVVQALLLIFVPGPDSQIVRCHGAEGIDKRTCQTCIRYQRNIEVDSGAAYSVTVVQLARGEVLRNVHHHIYLFSVQHFERLRVHVGLARPVDTGVLHPVLGKELARTAGSKQFIPFF